MHTENQLPRLSGSALKVPVWWWGGGVGSYPFLCQAPTPVEVELGCDKKDAIALLYKLHNYIVERKKLPLYNLALISEEYFTILVPD